MGEASHIISVRDLTCAYGPEVVLRDVAFEVTQGGVTEIL